MAHLDLDKVHAAEQEAAGEAKTVTIGGKTYTLAVKLNLGLAVGHFERNYRFMVECLFGTDAADEVLRHLEAEDLDRIAAMYGLDSGNSAPSAGSSPNGGRRSRVTSPDTSEKTPRPVDVDASGS